MLRCCDRAGAWALHMVLRRCMWHLSGVLHTIAVAVVPSY